MGLKTTNYTIRSNGLTLPEAYAAIRNIDIYGSKGMAYFGIHMNRENALDEKLEPLGTVCIQFDVNRNENPYVTAYNLAKSAVYVKKGSHVTKREMPFCGWEDDCLNET